MTYQESSSDEVTPSTSGEAKEEEDAEESEVRCYTRARDVTVSVSGDGGTRKPREKETLPVTSTVLCPQQDSAKAKEQRFLSLSINMM